MAANGYQKHILIGNLGADPKVTTAQNGRTVTNFDLAVNERNADGTEVVTWYGIAVWNGLGEACAQHLNKGRSVMVEGTRMQATAWFGRDNNLYTKLELTANEVKFLGGNGNGNSNGYHNGQQQRQAAAPRQQQRQAAAPRQQQRQAAAPRQQQRQQWDDNLTDEQAAQEIPF